MRRDPLGNEPLGLADRRKLGRAAASHSEPYM